MILVGFFESFGAAWAYGLTEQVEKCGKHAVIAFMFANFGGVGLGCALWFGLNENAVWGGFVGGILFYLAGVGMTGYFLKQKLAEDNEDKLTMSDLFGEIYMGNILSLRDRIQPVIGTVPTIWCVLMKHIIPQVLIVLFVNLARSDNGEGEPIFGGYGSYVTWPFQVLGMLTFIFALVIFVVGLAVPNLYAPLAQPQTKEAEELLESYGKKSSAKEVEKSVEEVGPEKQIAIGSSEEEEEC